MPTPIEIPVIVPGADQATRSMGQFDESVKKAETSTRGLAGATQAASEHLNTSGGAAQRLSDGHRKSAEAVESHTGKIREFGREIRKITPEMAEFIKASTSGFGLAIAGVELLKVGFESLSDAISERYRRGQKEITSWQEAISGVQESMNTAREKQDKKDATGFKSAMEMQEGLEAVGGKGARKFTEDLAIAAKVPIDKVTKVAIEGFQNGMTPAEISKVVHGAALGEQTGHGTFEQLAGGARGLLGSTQGRMSLSGTDADSASGLINSKGIKDYNSEKASADREKALQLQREQLHEFQRSHHQRLTAPYRGPGFVPEPGTSAADIYTQSSRQKGGVSESVDNIRGMDSRRSVEDLETALGHGPTVLQNDQTKEDLDKKYPGLRETARKYRENLFRENNLREKLEKGHEDSEKTWEEWMGPKGDLEEDLESQGAPRDRFHSQDEGMRDIHTENAQLIKAAKTIPGVNDKVFWEMIQTLKSIDNKMGKVSEGASKK